MTSLISWVGVDSRGPASFYFASDSRLSWPGKGVWDRGRKLFACRRYPMMFGYCGEVLFPSQTLSQITEMVDLGLIAVSPFDSIDHCTERVTAVIEAALQTYPPAAKNRFEIVYCIREGENMQSRFHLKQITFAPPAAATVSTFQIPNKSGPIAVLGSGSQSVRTKLDKWAASCVGGTSRAVFSAFCESLHSGKDPSSGGPPQLVGLWRNSPPQTFGMIWQGRRYFYGLEASAAATQNGVRWFNELFEICDPETLARKKGAQPQPRPRGT